MPSAKSCFNWTLFRKNFTRFWPVWSLYLLFWILMPLGVLNSGWSPDFPLGMLIPGMVATLFYAAFAAMAVFSYLYNNRSVQLMHALPITREGLFLTNYLSGLSFLLIPHLVTFVLTYLAGGYHSPYTLVLWLAVQSMVSLFFYSFAVYCAMFTGNLIALPIFYGILNGLAMGLLNIVTSLLREFLFGFAGTTELDTVVWWLTPVAKLTQSLRYDTNSGRVYYITGLSAVLVYTLAGILLAVAALLIYKKRHLEAAGDLVSVRPVRPVFKYGVAFCTAVTLGTFFYHQFRSVLPRARWAVLIPLLIWGAVGYFSADMLLKKRFKVFSQSWKGAVVFSLILVGLFVFTDLDLFGFNNPPKDGSVASVHFYGVDTKPYDSSNYPEITSNDPAVIDAALKLHKTISANKNTLRDEQGNGQNESWRPEALAGGGTANVQYAARTSLTLRYTLKDGREIRRQYDLPLHADDLKQEGSVENLLDTLINTPTAIEAAYWGGLRADASLINAALMDRENGESTIPNQVDRDRLLAAVKADMAAGRIGRRYLFDNAERLENCYYNDLTFNFYVPGIRAGLGGADWNMTVTVTLQTTATETLKVLGDLGYNKETFKTWADRSLQDYGEKHIDIRG